MKKLERNQKRYIIIFVYIVLFALLTWGLYGIFKADPTCFDGKKNQNELGVDCGGVCGECVRELNAKELSVIETAFVLGDVNRYDAMARITNPNISLGSSSFDYEFSLKDASGNTLATREGKGFILPKESKYVVEVNLETVSTPASVTFAMKNYQWSEFSGYEEPRLVIYQKNFTQRLENSGKSEAKGLLINESPFDFNAIKVNVILRNSAGKVAGIGSHEMRTINSGEQRDFRLLWPLGISEILNGQDGVEMEPEADVFDSQNFIKKYLEGQSLY
jgi:hypothetical protein